MLWSCMGAGMAKIGAVVVHKTSLWTVFWQVKNLKREKKDVKNFPEKKKNGGKRDLWAWKFETKPKIS